MKDTVMEILKRPAGPMSRAKVKELHALEKHEIWAALERTYDQLCKAQKAQSRHEIELALARHDPAEMARLGLSMDGDANRDLTARMLLVNVLEHNRVGFRNPSFTPLPKKLKEQIQELLGDY